MKVKDIIQEARSPEEFMSQLRSTAPDIKQVYQKYLKSPHYRPFRTSDDSTSEYHNWTDNFAQFLRKEFGHMPQDLAFEIGNHLYDYIKMRNREDPEGVAESGPFSYGAKKPRKGSVADLADKKRQEQERGKQPIEPKDQMVGVAKVTKGVAEGLSVSSKIYDQIAELEEKLKKAKHSEEIAFYREKIQDLEHKLHSTDDPFDIDDGAPIGKQGVAEQVQTCSECGGPSYSNPMLAEKKDACYHKVKSRVKVWPSAYASGQLVQCRKRGASNWGTGGKKK